MPPPPPPAPLSPVSPPQSPPGPPSKLSLNGTSKPATNSISPKGDGKESASPGSQSSQDLPDDDFGDFQTAG